MFSSPIVLTPALLLGSSLPALAQDSSDDALSKITLSAVSLCPLSVTVPSSLPVPSYGAPPPSYTPPPSTVSAFYTGEETAGMTKQCYYDALGSMVTRTISSIALCPLSIQARAAP
jgi:hypothetical protein